MNPIYVMPADVFDEMVAAIHEYIQLAHLIVGDVPPSRELIADSFKKELIGQGFSVAA